MKARSGMATRRAKSFARKMIDEWPDTLHGVDPEELAEDLDRFNAECDPRMPYVGNNPQSHVLVASCADCPFATGCGLDGAKPACLLESPVIGPGAGAVAASLLSEARPKFCPLVLGPVVVRLAGVAA